MRSTQLFAPTLVTYRGIQLPFIGQELSQHPHEIKELVKRLSYGIKNEPVELQGQAPLFFLFPLFAQLRKIATEIVYRSSAKTQAIILSSMLPSESYIHPFDVVEPELHWTEHECDKFDKAQSKDRLSETTIDLHTLWQENYAATLMTHTKKFLSEVYRITPQQTRVVFHGEAPIVPALLALNWFLSSAEEVFYNNIAL